ncbi:MAG TPA: cytochrome c biogenesis protein CcsA, partial [Vicinamibacterales bacterium]|nr:cytochrome c biogenesis protein CcsA [Vicinamibacterales bacterium]
FLPMTVITAAMFAYAPFLILSAPYESTMGLVQKIFYFHAACGMAMFAAAFVSGIGSAVFLFTKRASADRMAVAGAELTSIIGLIVLVTGPLWARKAWGVWWQWDARLTSTLVLWMIFNAYLLLRRYGGPGSDRLAAAVALFGMANVPFVYWSVNVWRTLHPKTSVIPSLQPGMRGPFWFCVVAFLLLFTVLLSLRTELEKRRQQLDELYLAADDQ